MWTKKVGEVMSREIITCNVNAIVESIYDLMKENRIHHMPIVNDNNEFVGIISYLDIMRLFDSETIFDSPGGWRRTKATLKALIAEEVMTKYVFSLQHDATIKDAVDLLNANQFHSIPVLKGKQIIGIITPIDIINSVNEKSKSTEFQ